MAKRPVEKIDFRPYGAAIKSAKKGHEEFRNKVGDEMYLSPRYLANIENKGQHPSLQIFWELMSRYHISVDQILLGNTECEKSTGGGKGIETLGCRTPVRHPAAPGRDGRAHRQKNRPANRTSEGTARETGI